MKTVPTASAPSAEGLRKGRSSRTASLLYFLNVSTVVLLLPSALMHVHLRASNAAMLDAIDLPRAGEDTGDSGAAAGPPKGLDFAIIGLPKTGTTFLLNELGLHPEVTMPPEEICDICHDNGAEWTAEWLRNASSAPAASGLPQKYGLKCPKMVRDTRAIDNLISMGSDTRLVVGVRNPVLWFQSFYNYRVYDYYNLDGVTGEGRIKSPFELSKGKGDTGEKHWGGLSTKHARFEVYLRQLAKVPITKRELLEMTNGTRHMPDRISPNPYKVFVYATEQLADKNATRALQLRKDLQDFLGLTEPIAERQVGRNSAKENSKQYSKEYDEHLKEYGEMDICNRKYGRIKRMLMAQATNTSRWIAERFIESPDVVVSGKEHFKEILDGWGDDPCPERPPKEES
ncbi:hypothetical protein ACHAXT_000676 [Thalassiosira profunda]